MTSAMRGRVVGAACVLAVVAAGTWWLSRGRDAAREAQGPAGAAEGAVDGSAQASTGPVRLHGVYEVSYDASVDVSDGQLLDLRVQATWVTVAARVQGKWQVRQQLQDVKVDSATQRDPLARERFVQELQRETLLSLDDTGAVTSLAAPADTSDFALRVLKTMAAFVQVVQPDGVATEWQVQEIDPVGAYLAEYNRSASGPWRKTKLRYDRVGAALPTKVPNAPNADLSTEIEESRGALVLTQRLLERADIHESTRVLDQNGVFQGMKSSTSVTLTRTAAPIRFASTTAPAGALVASALDAEPARTSPHSLDYVKIAGRNFSDMLTQLRKLPDDDAHRLERRELFVGLDALLRNDPAAVKQVVGRILADDAEATFLLDALSGCGGEAAQAAIVDLLRTRKLSVELEQRLISNLTVMRVPTAALTATLESLIGDPDLGRFALFATGAHGDYTRQTDPARAQHVIDLLQQGYRGASTDAQRLDYLSGLGNSAHPNVFPLLEQAYASRESSIRAAALNAMRAIELPQVDGVLASALITDPAGNVRAAAARALRGRTPTEHGAAALMQAAGNESHADARLTVLKTMREWLPRMPTLAPVIRALEARNEADNTR